MAGPGTRFSFSLIDPKLKRNLRRYLLQVMLAAGGAAPVVGVTERDEHFLFALQSALAVGAAVFLMAAIGTARPGAPRPLHSLRNGSDDATPVGGVWPWS